MRGLPRLAPGRLYNRVVMTALREYARILFYSIHPSPSVFHSTLAVFYDPPALSLCSITLHFEQCCHSHDTQTLVSIWLSPFNILNIDQSVLSLLKCF